MIGKLKELFKPKGPSGTKPRRSRVNLQRRYTMVSQTGQGSMSLVWRAVDNQSGRTVCLKVQNVEKNAAAAARSAVELRPPEGELASRVVHPHVVRTFDFGQSTQGEHFVVMEFIDGVSLQYIRETRSATLKEKLELLAQAAEGLAAVHEMKIIHHDIGPKNYLVDRDRQVKLIDFGLAVPNTPEFRRPGNRTGTLDYMAPELIRREPTDERIDIFSFGSMAFQLLTDRLPYEAAKANSMSMMVQRINSEPLDPSQADTSTSLPPVLHDLLRKLIARRKEDRWPTMSTLPEAFRKIASKVRR